MKTRVINTRKAYETIWGATLMEFDKKATHMLNAGFNPVGGICFENSHGYYVQSFMKEYIDEK